MAFTAAEKVDICIILGVSPSLLDAQIVNLGSSLTTDVETAVRANITRWNAGAGTKNVRIFPKESNMGVETDPMADKTDIRRNIGVLLEMMSYVTVSNGMGTYEVGI